jgi:membrane-associated protease RseP (regulator of RpoE activity)
VEEQRKKPILKIVALLAALGLAMACGAVLGGGGVYFLTELLGDRDSLDETRAATVVEGLREGGEMRLPVGGATIRAVMPDTPAEEAGLQVGDRVVAVDGEELGLRGDLAALIADYEPGDRVTLDVERSDGDEAKVKVRLGEHPDKAGSPYLGVRFSASPPLPMLEGKPAPFGDLERFEFDFGFVLPPELAEGEVIQRTRVVAVVDGAPASIAGVREGDIVTAVDGRSIVSAEELVEAIAELEPGDETVLSLYRIQDGGIREVAVVLGEHPEKSGAAYLGVEIRGYFRLQGGVDGEWPGGLRFYSPFDHDQLPGIFQRHWQPHAGDDA